MNILEGASISTSEIFFLKHRGQVLLQRRWISTRLQYVSL